MTNTNATSISERRNMLHRQNSFGVAPNRFISLFYRVKELTMSPDTTDEKITSTVLVRATNLTPVSYVAGSLVNLD